MGHARNYVTTDILRRILENYFGYQVLFIMNITDIDDKIIVRARQQHLLKAFQNNQLAQELQDPAHTLGRAAFMAFVQQNLPSSNGSFSTSHMTFDQVPQLLELLDKKWAALTPAEKDADPKFGMHYKTAVSCMWLARFIRLIRAHIRAHMTHSLD